MYIIGVNTGTSADAIDVGLFQWSGEQLTFIQGIEEPIEAECKQAIMAMVANPDISYRAVNQLKLELSLVIVKAVESLLIKTSFKKQDITVIGVHGQTIHHYPKITSPYSLQCQDGCYLAEVLAMDVVTDFRQTDMACGGMGAPLMPAFLGHCLKQSSLESAAFINLGGIASIAWVDAAGQFFGYDCGPANALMDAWVQDKKQLAYDDKGVWAASGMVNQTLLSRMMADDYISLAPPKSTGRETFSLAWLQSHLKGLTCSDVDVQATLSAFTVKHIQQALTANQFNVNRVYLHGKGIANTHMVKQLMEVCPGMNFADIQDLGLHAGWVETGLFAWLAACHKERKAVDLGSVTGGRRPRVLGVCYANPRGKTVMGLS